MEKIIHILKNTGFSLEKKNTNVFLFYKFSDDAKIKKCIEIYRRQGFYHLQVGGTFPELDLSGYSFSLVYLKIIQELNLNVTKTSTANTYSVSQIDWLLEDIQKYIELMDSFFDTLENIVHRIENSEDYRRFSSSDSDYYGVYSILLKLNNKDLLGNEYLEKFIELRKTEWVEDSKYQLFFKKLISENNLTLEKYKELEKKILEEDSNS